MRTALLTISLLVFAATGVGAQSRPTPETEPVFEGKPLSAWVDQLKEAAPQLRSAAAYALSGLGPAARASVPALIETLQDQDPTVRYAAAWALGEIGTPARAAIPALSRAREDDPHVDVRWSARKALRKIGRV